MKQPDVTTLVTTAQLTVAEARAARVQELVDAAEREQAVAAALGALADLIRNSPAPVQRWQQVWDHVERRLRRDAAETRRRAALANVRVSDVQHAVEARESWTPGSGSTAPTHVG